MGAKKMLRAGLMILAVWTAIGCRPQQQLPVMKDFSAKSWALTNQSGAAAVFPVRSEAKAVVVGFIYTYCPDICLMSTDNMMTAYGKLSDEVENGAVVFRSITFDPKRDTPGVLKQFAEIREINTTRWEFLTGEVSTVDSIMAAVGIYHKAAEGNSENYTIDHSDYIGIFDGRGRLRKLFPGSTVNPEDIAEAVRAISH